ncbi:MAG: class I SAM-dependent methyltransferase [Symploca sp. SIO2G7]|nr:class I SAM-dependent methyltransferase [Symploca sp. SIO2G7]
MENQASDIWEKVRQQFDTGPYPQIPLETSPKDNLGVLYIHNLLTAYYLRNQKVIETAGKIILDAGCGTGYKSLVLAQANPGARIVGIDLSEASVDLAKQRLQYHGFEDVEFHTLTIEDLPKLGLEFDYINSDDVLYLLPDPVVGLQAMKSVLKPQGMIRANFHSSLQRFHYYRAQEVFKMMGLMDDNPRELEIELLKETMQALKDNVQLKALTWKPAFENNEEAVLANHLLLNDHGYTIPEVFFALRAADLEFVSMVQWRQWDVMDLFKEPDNLPVFLGMSLPEASTEERLHLFELLQPVHRLLDFWCGHPHQAQPTIPVSEWTTSDWQQVKAYLHPQLNTPKFKQELISCLTQLITFEISRHLSLVGGVVTIDSTMATCLVPLLERGQSIVSLAEHWKKLRPLHPVTLEPTDDEDAFYLVQQLLTRLETLGYVLLER